MLNKIKTYRKLTIFAFIVLLIISILYLTNIVDNADGISLILVMFIFVCGLYFQTEMENEKRKELEEEKKILYVKSTSAADEFKDNLEIKLNELIADKKIIDDVSIHNAVGYNDNRKEAYIIYH